MTLVASEHLNSEKAMNIFADRRIVMTLDAGGTNLVFSAIQGGKEIVEPVTLPSHPDDLDKCLHAILNGFTQIKNVLPEPPVAISFAFPGPADYKSGIIGKLPNLPAFTEDGVALGPMLEDYFKLPTFIENDGNLFAYGEAVAGALPFINQHLCRRNIPKQYSNLIGVTLGTGFGAGLVINNTLCDGDNSAGGEIWLTRSFVNSSMFVESIVSSKAVQSAYASKATDPQPGLTPKDISEIALGRKAGDKTAAVQVFKDLAVCVAESLCNAVTLIDGVIVIGGGMSGAYNLLIGDIIAHMNGTIKTADGRDIPRLVSRVFDLENEKSFLDFLEYGSCEISVPFSSRKVLYTAEKRIGIMKSKIGTSRAISIGAYAIALQKLSANEVPDNTEVDFCGSSIL